MLLTRWLALLLVLVLSVTAQAGGPHPIDPKVQALYDHFLGRWGGTDIYVKDGATVNIAVVIVITRTKNPDELQMEYIYSEKGKPDYDHLVRYLSIDSAQSTVILHWKHKKKQTYPADSLQDVLDAGYGTFTFPDSLEKDGIYRAAFTLQPDKFLYKWEKRVKVGSYTLSGSWDLTRQP